ncbi:MAG: hypothetical protein IPK77_09740 [Cellvibrio sp.]|nr:hypothetical protein [Cellvibrio sp.]
MKSIKFFVVLILFGLFGCAAPVERGYDSQASYALNVWRASGMEGIMKDTVVPSSKVGSVFDSGTGRLVGLYSDNSLAKIGGVNPGFANAAGLVVALFEPEKPPFRDSFFYWEEYRDGESELELRKRVLESLKDPISSALSELGYQVVKTSISESKAFLVGSYYNLTINFTGNQKECDKYVYKTAVDQATFGACNLYISLPELKDKPRSGPVILGLNNKNYWYQSPQEISRAEISLGYWKQGVKLTREEKEVFASKFNTHKLLSKISKKMPKNYFLYLAPNNNTYGEDGKKIGFPLVLEKGESYSFVVSDKTQ